MSDTALLTSVGIILKKLLFLSNITCTDYPLDFRALESASDPFHESISAILVALGPRAI